MRQFFETAFGVTFIIACAVELYNEIGKLHLKHEEPSAVVYVAALGIGIGIALLVLAVTT